MNQITQYVNKSNDFLLPGELKPYLLIYAQHLSERGYTNLSVRGYIDSVSHFGTWLTMNEVSIKDIDVEVVERFAKHRCYCPGGRKKTFVSIKYANRVRKFIVFVCKQGGIPSYTPLEHSLPIPNAHFCEFLQYRGLLMLFYPYWDKSPKIMMQKTLNEPYYNFPNSILWQD